ncbi:kinase [Candidatus Methylopumilus universalis]|nr:kinase [Candidatus Methylopumilus universalis]
MVISKTPFRISFFGGGTDFPDWYLKNDGFVISSAIDKFCYISCRVLPPFFEHKYRISYSIVEDAPDINSIKHKAVREILNKFNLPYGIEIHSDADIPARSGIGSSSSFSVGLLNALYALQNQKISKSNLAEEAIHIEQNVLHENVGSQDQVAAAFGGMNAIYFKKNGKIIVDPLNITEKSKQNFNQHLMLFFTGFQRSSSDIALKQIENINANVEKLNHLHNLAKEAHDILIKKKNLNLFGELLNYSWNVKKSLADNISNDNINKIYDQAIKAGALGGKVLGAGGGGFILLFVEPKNKIKVLDKLDNILHVPFKFCRSGSEIIYSDIKF